MTGINGLISMLACLAFLTGCDAKPLIKVGDTPPEIAGIDIHGENVSLSKLKGKMVVIYFWKNSCCGDSVKKLEPFYRENKDREMAVLAVNAGDTKEVVESYAKNNAVTFTVLADEDSKLFNRYRCVGYPTIFILDKNGIVREKIHGDILAEQLQKLVVKQLNIQKSVEAAYEKIHSR